MEVRLQLKCEQHTHAKVILLMCVIEFHDF